MTAELTNRTRFPYTSAAVHAPSQPYTNFYDSMPGLSNPGRFCTSLVMRIARMVDPLQSVSGPTAPLSKRSVQNGATSVEVQNAA